jgi:hypothetical protein
MTFDPKDPKTERRHDYMAMLEWLTEFGDKLRKDVKETVEEVKEDIKDVEEKVTCLDKSMAIFEMSIKDHNKLLKGNGQPGLLKDFEKLRSNFESHKKELDIEAVKQAVEDFKQLKNKIYTTAGVIGFICGVLGWMIPAIIYFVK